MRFLHRPPSGYVSNWEKHDETRDLLPPETGSGSCLLLRPLTSHSVSSLNSSLGFAQGAAESCFLDSYDAIGPLAISSTAPGDSNSLLVHAAGKWFLHRPIHYMRSLCYAGPQPVLMIVINLATLPRPCQAHKMDETFLTKLRSLGPGVNAHCPCSTGHHASKPPGQAAA